MAEDKPKKDVITNIEYQYTTCEVVYSTVHGTLAFEGTKKDFIELLKQNDPKVLDLIYGDDPSHYDEYHREGYEPDCKGYEPENDLLLSFEYGDKQIIPEDLVKEFCKNYEESRTDK
jgi:hypothetical protein